MDLYGAEIQYEGPKMPRVKKAVFVLVNPSETDAHTTSPGTVKEENLFEAEPRDIKLKMPQIKVKSSFEKSADESVCEAELKGGNITTPQVSISPDKSGSFNVAGSSLNGEQDRSPLKSTTDNKQALSGKIKLPKVEFTSHYGKTTAKREGMGLKMERDSTPEKDDKTQGQKGQPGKVALAGFAEEPTEDVVSSLARTDLLDRDSSESPTGFTMEFSSTKAQAWGDVQSKSWESDEKESSSWFKVPKFTLKPHSTGKMVKNSDKRFSDASVLNQALVILSDKILGNTNFERSAGGCMIVT